MTTVEERLRKVEDRLEIIELEGCYARFFDARDAEGWAGLFTADGIYQARVLDGATAGTMVQGNQALHDDCRDVPFSGVHFMHLPQLNTTVWHFEVSPPGDRVSSFPIEMWGTRAGNVKQSAIASVRSD